MNCEAVSARVSAYLDRELADQDEREMFRHLTVCQRCRDFFRLIVEIKERVPRELRVEAPPAIGERIGLLRSVRRGDGHRLGSVRVSVPLPAAIACAAMLLIITLLTSPFLFTPDLPIDPSATVQHSASGDVLLQREFERLFKGELTK